MYGEKTFIRSVSDLKFNLKMTIFCRPLKKTELFEETLTVQQWQMVRRADTNPQICTGRLRKAKRELNSQEVME